MGTVIGGTMRCRDERNMRPKADSRIRFGKAKRCVWCGIAVAYKGKLNQPQQASREHLTPRSMGGGGGANVAVACRRCNTHRGSATDWVQFRELPKWMRRVGHPMRRVGGDFEPVLEGQ